MVKLTLAVACLIHSTIFWQLTRGIDEFPRREHSLVKPFHGAGTSLGNWDLLGSAFATNSHVQLTPDERSRIGGLWNRHKCSSRHWEVEVHFRVSGKGQDLFGDGLAVWYVRDRNTCPGGPQCTVFGNNDYFSGLGVFLDTYNNYNGVHNHEHPYISGLVNNGTLHYDHDSDGTHTQMDGCSAKFRARQHDTRIKVQYLNDVLTVYTDVDGTNSWMECMRVPSVVLPLGYYFGVTAATGDLSDQHDIISIRVVQLDTPDGSLTEERDRHHVLPSAADFDKPRERVEDEKPSVWKGIQKLLGIVCGVIVLCCLVVAGGFWYQRREQNSRKRFY